MIAQEPTVLAFDFGGTKLAAALVKPRSGRIVAYQKLRTPSADGAEPGIRQVCDTARRLLAENAGEERAIAAIGVSFGGPLSQDRASVLVSNHVPHWGGVRLTERLEDEFGFPAFMENDANIAALGEATFGAGKNAASLLYVQVSTGIGCGFVADGRLLRGQGLAGELGHITVIPGGPDCSCGKRGCLESISAGWAIARDGRLLLRNLPPNHVLWSLCQDDPQRLTAESIFQAARSGDQDAGAVIERAMAYLGLGIASAISILHPQIVVLGGGIAQSWDLILPVVKKSIRENLPPFMQESWTLEQAALGGQETVLGAAILAYRRLNGEPV